MKRVLNAWEEHEGPLDITLSSQTTGIKEGDDDSVGDFLLLRKDIQGLITDFLYVEIGHTISVQNLFLENQDIVAIGCGAPLFRASFASLETNSLKEAKLNVLTAMNVTAELSPYCNDVIDMRTYKVYNKGVLK